MSSLASSIGQSPTTAATFVLAMPVGIEATRDPRLFDLVVQFNLFPALELHPTWLSMLGLSETVNCLQGASTNEMLQERAFSLPLWERDRVRGKKNQPYHQDSHPHPSPSPIEGEGVEGGYSYRFVHQETGSESNASPWWVRQLSRACLLQFELDRQFDMDFSDHGKRLALLPVAVLQPLTQLVLAITLRDELRKRIDRASVQRLQQLMGETTWRHALQWQGAIPPMPTLAATSSLAIDLNTVDELQWQQCVLVLLLAMVPINASGVRGRLQLKFPQAAVLSAVQAEARLPERLRELLRLRLLPLYAQVLAQHFAGGSDSDGRHADTTYADDLHADWAWLLQEPSIEHRVAQATAQSSVTQSLATQSLTGEYA